MTHDGDEISISSELSDFRFGIVPDWVLLAKDSKGKGLSGADLRVYISMRTFANKVREAHPKVRTIAERADVTVRTAEKSISRLRDMGLIVSKRWYRDEAKKEIGGCHYKMLDFDPTGHMAGRVPAKRTEGSRPDDRSKKRPVEETKEREVQCSPTASGAAGDNTSERKLDRELFNSSLTSRLYSYGGPEWIEGKHRTDLFYEPMYRKLYRKSGKVAWPGAFVAKAAEEGWLDEWLMEQGLEQVT